MKIVFDSAEEMFEYLETMRKHFAPEEKRPMSNAEKQKAYRERKKATESNELVTDSNGTNREEREEKRDEEEVSPLTSPLSFSPNTPYPIPPISPLPEEAERKGEREEIERAKSPKPVKNRYGNFQHVLLTAEEHSKLCEKFPHNISERIQRLDDYLENNRKKHYDNHYLTILNWARKDEEKKQTVSQKPEKKTYSFAEVGEMMRRGEL